MQKTFKLKIITPRKIILDTKVVSLVAPAYLGYLGILANHAPMVAVLKEGNIILKDASEQNVVLLNMAEGFLKVYNNEVVILTDNCQLKQ